LSDSNHYFKTDPLAEMHIAMMLSCIFHIALVLVESCNGEIIATPRIKRQYGLYATDYVIRSFQPTSLFTCAENCVQMKLCASFNFLSATLRCELNYGGIPIPKDSSTYVVASDIPQVGIRIQMFH
jgi:hypothetical protein